MSALALEQRNCNLLSDDLDEDFFAASPIEFAVEDLFPRPEIQLPLSDGDDDFPPHDLSFHVSVSVVLAGAIVLVPRGRWIKRCQALKPLGEVGLQA
jgi:hypothetical protein